MCEHTTPQISIIVPLFFADPHRADINDILWRFLQQFREQACASFEVFLSDSGPPAHDGVVRDKVQAMLSQDPWLASRVVYTYVARDHGPLSRGAAMNLGVQQTTGAIVLFLHIDCLLPPRGLCDLLGAITQGVLAGGFLKTYDQKPWWSLLQLTERYLNGIRSVVFRQLVGTNAIFMTRSLASTHPYRDDFLEDVELSDWLRHHVQGKSFRVLRQRITVSAQKYRKYGVLASIAINAAVMTLYRMFSVSPALLKRHMYHYRFATGWRFWPEYAKQCWLLFRNRHEHNNHQTETAGETK